MTPRLLAVALGVVFVLMGLALYSHLYRQRPHLESRSALDWDGGIQVVGVGIEGRVARLLASYAGCVK